MGHGVGGDGSAAPWGSPRVRLSHLRPGVACVHVQGRLDHAAVPGFQHVVLGLLAAAPWAVVLDLRAVTGLAPGAGAALVELVGHAGEADIGLNLVAADRRVVQALATAGVRRLVEIHPSTPSALRTMSRPQSDAMKERGLPLLVTLGSCSRCFTSTMVGGPCERSIRGTADRR
ncbi:STAS domain-containing protein, partial [Pseudonocardia sp. H11422]|uniref:STAS domain-containing protein n=1 Tax=Pseudonocardia sp. H11422 TaxID=2835866 RepID=UPI003977A782